MTKTKFNVLRLGVGMIWYPHKMEVCEKLHRAHLISDTRYNKNEIKYSTKLLKCVERVGMTWDDFTAMVESGEYDKLIELLAK